MAAGNGLSVEVGSSILGGIATIGKTTSTAATATEEVGPVGLVGWRWLAWPEDSELEWKRVSENLGEESLQSVYPGFPCSNGHNWG